MTDNTPRETPEQAAQRCYNHGGYHANAAATEDAMRAFVNGAGWAATELKHQATDPDVIATIKARIYTPHVVGGSAVIEATLKAFVETVGGEES